MQSGGAVLDRGARVAPRADRGDELERQRVATAVCVAWARAAGDADTAAGVEALSEERLATGGVRLYQLWRETGQGATAADALASVPAAARSFGRAFYVTEGALYTAPCDERDPLGVVEAHLERMRPGDTLVATTPRAAAVVARRDAWVVYDPDGGLLPNRAALYRTADAGWAAVALRLALTRGGPLAAPDGTHGRGEALLLCRRQFGAGAHAAAAAPPK